MANDITISGKTFLDAMNILVNNLQLDDLKTTYNLKTKTATVVGSRDGIQYATTMTAEIGGGVQTSSQFIRNMPRNALGQNIKNLRAQGFKQTQIADMLGISQATVSNYLKKF